MPSIVFEYIKSRYKDHLASTWIRQAEAFFAPYLSGTQPLTASADPFTSPILHRINAAADSFAELLLSSSPDIAGMTDAVGAADTVNTADRQEHFNTLEECIRIIALQAKTPAEVLNLFFQMKKNIRKLLAKVYAHEDAKVAAAGNNPAANKLVPATLADAYAELERRFDTVIIAIISMYICCREKICSLRMEETLRSQSSLLRLLAERSAKKM